MASLGALQSLAAGAGAGLNMGSLAGTYLKLDLYISTEYVDVNNCRECNLMCVDVEAHLVLCCQYNSKKSYRAESIASLKRL